MKSQTNSGKFKSRTTLVIALFTVIGVFFLLSLFKVNRFIFSGDTEFVDSRRLRILSLNLLKDQPIFWINKKYYEKSLKDEFPQIKFINYKILSSDTLEIEIIAEEICCVISDSAQKYFLISSSGLILQELDFNSNTEIKLFYLTKLTPGESIPNFLAEVLKDLHYKNFKISEVKDNEFFIENESIYFYTTSLKKVIFGQNTELKKLDENIKSMTSFLDQNKKNYSILDFRFEKIVVK